MDLQYFVRTFDFTFCNCNLFREIFCCYSSIKDSYIRCTAFTRRYTETGLVRTVTDGRGNASTTHTDIAGRPIAVTDAAGNTTTTNYCPASDNPSAVTNALGNTANYADDCLLYTSLRPINHHRDIRRAVEGHRERVKAYSRKKTLNLHAVFPVSYPHLVPAKNPTEPQ